MHNSLFQPCKTPVFQQGFIQISITLFFNVFFLVNG